MGSKQKYWGKLLPRSLCSGAQWRCLPETECLQKYGLNLSITFRRWLVY